MSQENVETMREAYRSFDRGEANLLFELLQPDIVWEAIEDTEPKHGVEGMGGSRDQTKSCRRGSFRSGP